MAALALPIAQKIGSEVLPVLIQRYKDREAVADDVLAIMPTITKVTEMLGNLTPPQQEAVAQPIKALQAALAEADTILQALLAKEEAAAAAAAADAPAGGGGMLAKAKATAAAAAKAAKEVGVDVLRGEAAERHQQLTELNQRLLHASLDLSLALSRLPPPKTGVCLIM